MGELVQSEYRRMRARVRYITVPSNNLVPQIHDRMPAILEPASYKRWLGFESPRDLLITYPLSH
jgi:putative SOS response-associated peptidase YedK